LQDKETSRHRQRGRKRRKPKNLENMSTIIDSPRAAGIVNQDATQTSSTPEQDSQKSETDQPGEA